MTIEEFNKTGFTGQMRCTYKGEEYLLASVDFEEQLIGILLPDNQEQDDYELTWVRCENVELKDNVVLRQPDVSGSLRYVCNADCPDVEYGNCCHPSNCQKKLVPQ